VLDTFAAMISGSRLPPGRASARFLVANQSEGDATVVAPHLLCDPLEAALVNGILAHSDESDDSNAPSQSHPGCLIVSASLASGEHFLRAVALGYDIGPRMTIALGGAKFQDDSHRSTHSIAGTFGSAAAAGCVAELSAQPMRWLLDYAAQQAFRDHPQRWLSTFRARPGRPGHSRRSDEPGRSDREGERPHRSRRRRPRLQTTHPSGPQSGEPEVDPIPPAAAAGGRMIKLRIQVSPACNDMEKSLCI
jgi:hypothetical protein